MTSGCRILFSAADGSATLEGRLRLPDAPAVGGAVVCHPHPAFGGHMDVWLLPAIGVRLAAAGWAVLRFNFRGVGRSTGRGGDGVGEVADVHGALALLRAHLPAGAPCALVGWSFGAVVALHAAAADPAVTTWVGIAPPTRPLPDVPMVPPPQNAAAVAARRVVLVGEHDQFYPPSSVAALAPHDVHVLPGADHFFFDRDEEVGAFVATAVADVAAECR